MTRLPRAKAWQRLLWRWPVRLLSLLAILMSCVEPAPVPTPAFRCDAQTAPPVEQTAAALAACLTADTAPADGYAARAGHLLTAWGRMNSQWGGVWQAHLLPGDGMQLLVAYHADLQTAAWNPQGRFAVLSLPGDTWQVIYDFDGTRLGIKKVDGSPWDNWSYRLRQAGDITEDGLDDVLVTLTFSDGLHTGFEYEALLTCHANAGVQGLHVIYLERTDGTMADVQMLLDRQPPLLRSVIRVGNKEAITRTLAFDGTAMRPASLEIDPALHTVSAHTPDGADWYGFDRLDGSIYNPALGVFRTKNGQVQHFEITGTLRALRPDARGSLYAVAGSGLYRYQDGKWDEVPGPDSTPVSNLPGFIPVDIAFGRQGDLWVAGRFGLAHFDGTTWTQHDVRAEHALVAPDGTVWTDGWDGRANSDCCFSHLTGTQVITYAHGAHLPVSPELEAAIRHMGQ